MRIHGVIRLRETTGRASFVCSEIEKRAKQLFHDRKIGTFFDFRFNRNKRKVFFAFVKLTPRHTNVLWGQTKIFVKLGRPIYTHTLICASGDVHIRCNVFFI